jgi:putative CocE/NonD family hydrolase
MSVEFHWHVRIPMRDGVQLSAAVYVPADQSSPAPSVVTVTPYTCDQYHERGVYFASRGVPFVIVDVRGRGNSEGTFRPFSQEANDACDVIEWLARQPYCNGKVAMWGGSYGGYAQWAAARERPPHLATIVPVAAPCLGVDFPMRNNVFHPFLMRWLTLIDGRTAQRHLFGDETFWSAQYRRWHESGRSFRELDTMLGNPSPIFQEWLTHPEPDAYWDAHNPASEEYARLQLPVLTITGSYDDDQAGALEHYRRHMRNAAVVDRMNHYLIIGPWDHAGTRTPQAEVGGVALGRESLLDLGQLHLDWYAWTMGYGAKPAFLQKPVAYYVMGAETWRYADTIEQVTASHEAYFLDSPGHASDVFAAGSLSDATGSGPPDQYVYDPRDTHGPEVDAEALTSGGSLVDQRLTFALRGKALVYHSAPFTADTEVSGFFRLRAWIAIDRPDTDVYVSVDEIDEEGGSIRLSTDAIRARYREGLRHPRLIATLAPLRYDFERFTFVSRRIKRGHRLRLVIAPMGRLIEATFAQKNYNTGGVVAEESAQAALPVTVSVLHDAAHPSALYVPLASSPDISSECS